MGTALNLKTALPTDDCSQLPKLFLGVTFIDKEFVGRLLKDVPIRWFVHKRTEPPAHGDLIERLLDEKFPDLDPVDRKNSITMGLQYFTEAERDQWTAHAKDEHGYQILWAQFGFFSSVTRHKPYGFSKECLQVYPIMLWMAGGHQRKFEIGGAGSLLKDTPDWLGEPSVLDAMYEEHCRNLEAPGSIH